MIEALPRESKYDMIPVAEAVRRVLACCSQPLPPRRLPLHEALGYSLASEVQAPEPFPPFPASVMV
jgi:molybdopterin biosynthesis enzyme